MAAEDSSDDFSSEAAESGGQFEDSSRNERTDPDDSYSDPDSDPRDPDAERLRLEDVTATGGERSVPSSDLRADEMRKAVQVFRRETDRLGMRDGGAQAPAIKNPFAGLWHGRVFEFFRNDVLDAVPHEVVQRGGEANVLRRNQFGFSVSGPAYLPKIYDGRRSTFFTFSYEGTRQKVGRSSLTTLPTALQRSADFSDLVDKAGGPVTIYDPASTRRNAAYDPSQVVSRGNLEFSRDPFPNNRIPAGRLDPVAGAMEAHYPLPNTNVGPFLQNNYWVNPPEENTPDGFLARVDQNFLNRHKLTVDLAYSKGFYGNPDIYPTMADPGRPDRHFSNRELDVRETFTVSANAVYTGSFEVSSDGTWTPGLDSKAVDAPKDLGLEGVSGRVFPTVRFKGFEGLGADPESYFRNFWTTYETEHSLMVRRGKHSWSFSSRLRWYQLNTFEPESPSGYLQFNDELTGLPGIKNTGSSFASFLLGRSHRAEVSDLLHPSYLRQKFWRTSVRDEYELRPNLTATLSVRLDVNTPRVEKFDRQSTIDLQEPNPEAGQLGALIFAGRNGRGRAFQPVRARLEPRLGLAWSPTRERDTVVRLTFMHYYSSIPLRSGPFATQGFNARRTFISPNEQLEPAVELSNGLDPLDTPLPNLSPSAANGTNADFVADTSRQPRYRYARIDFEKQLPMGLTARIAGRMYRGKDIRVSSDVAGINAIPLDTLRYRDRLNDESFRRTLRPYPQFQEIRTSDLHPMGRYRYERGSIEIEKTPSKGLAFEFEYSVRKQRDDYTGPGVQDFFNRDNEWALTPWLRPHELSWTYVYELPFGTGKSMLNGRGLWSRILGNWSVSGFTTWADGDPITLEPLFNNTGGVVPFLRVQAVPGVDPHVDNPGPELYFNPAAFVEPDDFTIGNVSRSHPTLRNPGYHNHDISVTKRVELSSEKTLELLFQGFNFINHANWNEPDAVIGPANAPNANAGKIIGSTGGRVVQLGLRYSF